MEGAKNNVVIPSVNTVSPSEGGDVPTKVEYSTTVDENEANDNKWYTIDGRPINKTLAKGYLHQKQEKGCSEITIKKSPPNWAGIFYWF